MIIVFSFSSIRRLCVRKCVGIVYCEVLTLIRLGYFGGWKDWWGGGGPIMPPLEISAVDRAITAKICTMVVCDVIYKIVYLDFPK